MTQKMNVVCLGDTDWFSFYFDAATLVGSPKVFGTSSANPLVETAGNWLGVNQWDTIKHQNVPGQEISFSMALMGVLKELVAGTKTFEHAVASGHNAIACLAYRENGCSPEVEPEYGFRFLGSFSVDTDDAQSIADAAMQRLPLVVPMLLEDAKQGYLHPDSLIFQNLVVPTLGSEGQPAQVAEPAGVKFRVFTDETGQEKLAVVCYADPDQAKAWSEAPRVSLEIVQGVSETPHGALAFLIWAIGIGRPAGVCLEQFANPSFLLSPQFSMFAAQETFDFVILDRVTGEQVRHILYPSEGVFEETQAIAQSAVGGGGTDMGKAIEYFVQTTTLSDLLPERLRV
ncbi:hypothetical protein [Celeribacter litoreus]|uniref:hypothetical protein n=1 Tax=Celeribacter litoreus TaxID=2876714 RepID=UPI001CCC9FC4|nr:hypothetical protein [Celeribacter litoreus]MCA0044650.1 hypothetical protein [Celeribacter litoreus]